MGLGGSRGDIWCTSRILTKEIEGGTYNGHALYLMLIDMLRVGRGRAPAKGQANRRYHFRGRRQEQGW